MSMITILPKRDETLKTILTLLANTPMSEIFNSLAFAQQNFADVLVDVYLPKFVITSDLTLNSILIKVTHTYKVLII